MKRAALAVLAAALVPLALPARGQPADTQAPAKRRVLITAFEPFDGREENNSTRIANMMKAHPELFPDMEITVCTLPVVYDEATAVALACMDRMTEKPDMVLSMGEVGCKIQLETSAGNMDDVPGAPDNAGNVRSDRVIVEGGPARLGFSFPAQAMFCALSPEERKLVDVSASMNYVCNNTAFLLGHKLRGSGIPHGFIHVPTAASYCGEANDPLLNARLIAHMIGGAFADRSANRATTYALPHCTNDERLPTSLDELSRAAASIAEAEDIAACEKEFLDTLKGLIR